jgi:hypothetical protein
MRCMPNEVHAECTMGKRDAMQLVVFRPAPECVMCLPLQQTVAALVRSSWTAVCVW